MTPRYVVAFYVLPQGEGWAVLDTQTRCRTSDLGTPQEACEAASRQNAAAAPAVVLAHVAQGIGSSPSPDQLTRLHEAARAVLGGGQ